MGDTYTFGDGVRQRERWPNQLVRILRPRLDLDLVANLAGRSIASRDVLDEQVPELATLEPRFVSIQVGANDVCLFDESTPTSYADNMGRILDATLEVVPADRVVVLTTPDFTLAPSPPDTCRGDLSEQAERIGQLNAILGQVAGTRGVTVVDISPIADRVADDPTLVASDSSHPSAKQYGAWADLAALTIRRLFADPEPSEAPSPDAEGPPA